MKLGCRSLLEPGILHAPELRGSDRRETGDSPGEVTESREMLGDELEDPRTTRE